MQYICGSNDNKQSASESKLVRRSNNGVTILGFDGGKAMEVMCNKNNNIAKDGDECIWWLNCTRWDSKEKEYDADLVSSSGTASMGE